MRHDNKDAAIQTADRDAKNARLMVVDNKPCIQVTIRDLEYFYFDSDVVITEVSQEKRALMGRPLDTRVDADKALAVQSLLSKDSAYMVTEDDMVASQLTLSDFVDRYGVGYRMDHIAYAVIAVLESECVDQENPTTE